MADFDLLVLGAGPAGCAVALRARQAGLRVLVLDANGAPKASPGETLHPGIEALFKQLGVLDAVLRAGFRRQTGIWLESATESGAESGITRQFLPYGADEQGPWAGFQADRKILHQILQDAVREAGAEMVRNARLGSLIYEGSRVAGVVANGQPYHARWTVDATGRTAWLAKQLGLPVERRSPPIGVRFGWRDGSLAGDDGNPVFSFREDGWNWRAPLAAGRTAWVELRIGKPGGEAPSGVDLTWQLRPECAGPGFFLVGDAAATLDPSSSHGVLRALMSGILLGHLMEGYHRSQISQESVIESYRQWLCEQFSHDENHLKAYYASSLAGRAFAAVDESTAV